MEWRNIKGTRIADVNGVAVVIRPIPEKLDGSRWRLSVAGQLAMGEQFHRTMASAKQTGVKRANSLTWGFANG